MNTLIHKATVINEGNKFKASVLIEGERISRIYTDPDNIQVPAGTNYIHAEGKLLLPGIIDDQVHFREPGLTHKADISSETMAAIAGGITSIMEMPNTIPQTITNKLLKEKQKIGQKNSLCNFSFYLGATNDNIEEIKSLDPTTTCGVKVFMGSSTGNMLVNSTESLRKIFAESPVLVACHCEDDRIIEQNFRSFYKKYGDDIPLEYHPLIRSREACMKSSGLAAGLAAEYGTRLHILHLSTAEEMSLFTNDIPLNEKRITAEVCVHHLWFDDRSYETKGSLIKWNPAIKNESDKKALIESVNNDKIDIIASDHAPHTIKEKQNIYTKSASGGPLVQHSLHVMLELWNMKALSLEKIVEKMCHNPAVLFNIEERGFIREGYKADLCLINSDSPWLVSRENTLYKCGWSPFEGQEFSCKVEQTFVNGRMVFDNGRINSTIKGQLLTFNR